MLGAPEASLQPQAMYFITITSYCQSHNPEFSKNKDTEQNQEVGFPLEVPRDNNSLFLGMFHMDSALDKQVLEL